MEETWKEKLWERSRDRITEIYRRASSVDIETFLRTSIIGHVGKDILNRAKRKYELRKSFKHIKLRQFVTRLRMGRLGYLFLLFAALGTLAVPLVFQDRLPQQLDREFETANIRQHAERGMDDSFTGSIKLAKEMNLIHEEGKASLETSRNKPDFITIGSDKKENVDDDVSSEGESIAVLTSEDVKLPDPLQRWRKSDLLESELSESHDVAPIRKSDITISEEKTDRPQKATPTKPSRRKRNKFKRRSSLDPFHALASSAETLSSNMAPPVTHSTVDTVGSSGFTEAFEEVLKLASEANKTAREKPAELQEESSMAELLPTDKPAELDVGSLKLSKEKNALPEGKDTIASKMGLAYEEQKSDISVDGDSDALRREADESKAVADESKAVADETKTVVDETATVADESKAVADESKAVVDEIIAVADESKEVADEPKTVVDETATVADESKAVVDETKAVADEPKTVVDETKAVADEPKTVVDETATVADESKAVADEPKKVVDETATVADESKAVADEPKKVVDETATVADESKAVADEPKTVVDETATVADESKAVVDETKAVADEPKTVVDETKAVADEPKTVVDETATVADESKAVADEPKKVVDETATVADESKAVADEPKTVVDETATVADESKAVADELKAVVDESMAVADESKAVAEESKAEADEPKTVVDGTATVADAKAVLSEEKPNNGVVREQVMQAGVRQENGDYWSQESALISSLKQRVASGTLKVGLLNMEATDLQSWQFLAGEMPIIIPFDRVNEKVGWNDLYPEWMDEEEKYGTPECPLLPSPKVSLEVKLDVVIVRAPCTASSALQEGWKHPASLQILLGAASLAVKAGNENAYVLILSECRPLVNLFTCGELLEHRDQGWLYQVNLEQLEKRFSLPVGSCELSVSLRRQDTSFNTGTRKNAYATVLHSGGDYVCGAIATAHSIRKTGSIKDLVILVDSSISPEHRQALKEAGWKVRDFERIYKSNTVGGKQYEKDFSKFCLWQLTDYNKVVYVEADVLVLRNLDHLFLMPEVSGSGSAKTLFNSGVMVIEPSNCTFQLLMDEMEKVASQIGGELDFLNGMFPWWHRIPRHMNYLKYFWIRQNNEDDYMNRLFSSEPPQLYAIHYWGYKPWQCFRDYDCNWNVNQQFASDEAHNQWFKVYDDMPWNLQKHCALSTGTKAFLEHNRRTAETAAFPDKHWAVNITDPRLNVCQESHCDWNALLSHWDKTTSTVVASTR